MTVRDIYSRYHIPPNVIRHMYDVTGVGLVVCGMWPRNIDTQLVKEVLLLHDLGNIVKFTRPFLGELESQHWLDVQDEFIQKYGKSAHNATQNILQELHADEPLYKTIDGIGRLHTMKPEEISDELCIAEFADCCVSPEGIVGFRRRIEDLKTRYKGKPSLDVPSLEENGRIVQQMTGLDVDNLPVEEILKYMTDLPQTELTHLLDR